MPLPANFSLSHSPAALPSSSPASECGNPRVASWFSMRSANVTHLTPPSRAVLAARSTVLGSSIATTIASTSDCVQIWIVLTCLATSEPGSSITSLNPSSAACAFAIRYRFCTTGAFEAFGMLIAMVFCPPPPDAAAGLPEDDSSSPHATTSATSAASDAATRTRDTVRRRAGSPPDGCVMSVALTELPSPSDEVRHDRG